MGGGGKSGALLTVPQAEARHSSGSFISAEQPPLSTNAGPAPAPICTPPTPTSPNVQERAPLREALLRMRADEACIHHLNIVLADLRPGDRQAARGPAPLARLAAGDACNDCAAYRRPGALSPPVLA